MSNLRRLLQNYKANKRLYNIAILVIGGMFIVGLVNHTAAQSGAYVTPSQNQIFSLSNPQLTESFGCPPQKLAGGIVGAATGAGEIFTIGREFAEYQCIIYKYENGEITDADLSGYLYKNQGGLNQSIYNATAVLIDQKPASGASYIDSQVYALSHLGQVNAQAEADNVGFYYPGTGFSLLSPIQDFWGWSVNVVYGFLVILIIIVAFGIMFRARLGGAAAITLQSAIPNIALAMILVPLSYAITGLFVDVITLGTNVVHEFVMGPGAPARETYTQRDTDPSIDVLGNKLIGLDDRGYYADDPRLYWYTIWTTAEYGDSTKDLLQNSFLFHSEPMKIANSVVKAISGFATGDTDINLLEGKFSVGKNSPGLETWIGEIINVIIQFIMLLTGLRIFWLLLKKFFVLMISPIFAPFVFATVALPGTGLKIVMMYLKMLWAASLFYIITYAMFILSIVLTSASFQEKFPDFANSGYVPPLLGIGPIIDLLTNDQGQIANQSVTGFMMGVISLVIFLQIPKTLNDLDERMGTNKNMLAPIMNSTLESARYSLSTGKALAGTPGNIADAFDRARGIEPGEFGSVRSSIRRRTSAINSRLDTTIQQGNSVFSRTGARLLKNTIGRGAAAASGSTVQGAIDTSKPTSLKASLGFSGQPIGGGYFQFTRQEALEISRTMYLNDDGTRLIGPNMVTLPPVWDVILEADNFTLPTTLNRNTVTVISYGKDTSGRGGTPRTADKVPTGASTVQFADGADLFKIGNDAGISVTIDNNNITNNGQKASIGLKVVITDATLLFGYDIATDTLITQKAKIGAFKTQMGSDIAFRVNGVTSNPVKFSIQMTRGNN